MPTIANLPAAIAISPTDTLAIDQGSGTNSVTVATLLEGLQPAIISATGTLLGRISTGAGSPETVSLGSGLVMSSGTLTVGGSITGLLDGETVDQLQAASLANDTDSFAVDQGGAALVRQTFAALWSYVATKLPIALHRVAELTSDTVLDATSHNNAILVCSSSLTLSANFLNMGSGFSCQVINLSSGPVTMGQGITVGSGNPKLPPQTSARLVAISYSAGNIVFWDGLTSAATSASASGAGSTTSSSTGTTSGSTTSTTSTTSLAFVAAPSGSYSTSQASVGVNATLTPGTAASGVQFGISTSTAIAPSNWVSGSLVNTQSNGSTFWGAFLTMPATAGTYYCWVETIGGATTAVSAAFTVA